MIFRVCVIVSFKEDILEPQGQAIMLTSRDKKRQDILNIRVGKHIEIDLEAGSKEEAFEQAEKFTKEILYNPVMEKYKISL